MLNWFAQILAVTSYGLRTLPERKGAAVVAAVGIAGVVAVFVGVLSIAVGFHAAMTAAGSPDVVVVTRGGSDNEMSSNFSREEVRIISDAPGIARDSAGPLASGELINVLNVPKRTTGTDANVPLRGIGPAAYAARGNIQLVEGRKFEPGRNEIIAGASAARAFAGLEVGHKLVLAQNEWTVVGIFTADGGVAESEIWVDAPIMQGDYHLGDTYQSVRVRLASPDAFTQFKDALTSDPRLNVKVQREAEYYADQSQMITLFIGGMGVFIAVMMGLGALFGALNTMYSAVAARTREIATLRALGFGTGAVVLSVLLESLVIALIGGAAGAAAAYLVFNGYQASTINWQTFSQVAFAFRVTPLLLLTAILGAAFIGLLGGLFPAIRAARLPIATGLRES